MFKIGRLEIRWLSKPQPLEPPDKVKCAECGFLAVRNQQTRGLHEVEADMRKNWSQPIQRIDGDNVATYVGVPLCFRKKLDFLEEAEKVNVEKGAGFREQIISVFEQERDCSAHTPWNQGFTPKEHQDVIDQRVALIRDRLWALGILVIGVLLGALIRGS